MSPMLPPIGLAVVVLASIAPESRAADPTWTARYEVRFGATEKGIPKADVHVALEWIGKPAPRPPWVDVGMADDAFPGGYGAFVRDFRPAETKRLDERLGRHHLPVADDGSVAFDYSVVLEHDAAGWGPGPDEAPYAFDGGAFWTGRALFVTPPRCRFEVTLAAPPGEHVSTSFAPVEARPGAFAVESEARLRDSFLMVGRHAEKTLRVGGATVTLALAASLEPSLPHLESSVETFLAAAGDLFRSAPEGRILVCGSAGAPKGSFHGGTFSRDVSLLVDSPLGPENRARWVPFVCHEILHLWIPGPVGFEGQQYWFTEGFTDYYARVLAMRTGAITPDELRADWKSRIVRALDVRTGLSLVEAGESKFSNSTLVYEGGSLAALCLDLEIRGATANKKSLDDVMRGLFSEYSKLPRRVATGRDVARIASAVSGLSLDDFFARHVNGHEDLPLEAAFRRAGVAFSRESADLPSLRSIARTLIACPSMTEAEGGVKVFSTVAEPFLEDDVIVAVEGRTVASFDDLRRAFRGLVPRQRVAVTVLRKGAPTPLDLDLGGDPAVAVPTSRFVEVRLDDVPGADVLALAIRKAIFGENRS